MGFLSDTWKKVKKVTKPLSWFNPLTALGIGSDTDALKAYGTAALGAGAGASLLGGLGGVTSAAGAAGTGNSTLGNILGLASTATDILGDGASVYAGLEGVKAQRDINKANLDWAREQHASQQAASASQYQRATEDMRKAGINPMLAYKQGGAAMPGVVQAPQLGNPVTAGVNSATAVQGAINQTNQTRQNIIQSEAMVKKINQEVSSIAANKGLTRAQTVQVVEGTKKVIQEVKNLETVNSKESALAALKKMEADYFSDNSDMFIANTIGNKPYTIINSIIESSRKVINNSWNELENMFDNYQHDPCFDQESYYDR